MNIPSNFGVNQMASSGIFLRPRMTSCSSGVSISWFKSKTMMALHFPSRLFKAKRASFSSSSSSLSTIKSLVSSSSSLSKSVSMLSSSSSTRRHDLDFLYLSFFFVRAENCMRASVDYWLGDLRFPKLTANGVTFSDLLPLFHSDFNNNT